MESCAVLCCAVLCCAVLCCAVLCCAALIQYGTTMAKLGEKIERIELYKCELALDREDFSTGKIGLQLDARVAKTWVRQIDQVISRLTEMLDDWKEVAALSQDSNKDAAAGNVITTKKSGNGSASPSDESGFD